MQNTTTRRAAIERIMSGPPREVWPGRPLTDYVLARLANGCASYLVEHGKTENYQIAREVAADLERFSICLSQQARYHALVARCVAEHTPRQFKAPALTISYEEAAMLNGFYSGVDL